MVAELNRRCFPVISLESATMPTASSAAVRHKRLRMLSAVAVLYWLVLTVLMHMPLEPRPPQPDDGIPKDKTVHFTLYAGLAVCFVCVLEQRARVDPAAWPRNQLSRYLAVLSFCTVHGFIEELTQPLTGRTYDLADFLADCWGAILGLVGYFVASKLILAMQNRRSAG